MTHYWTDSILHYAYFQFKYKIKKQENSLFMFLPLYLANFSSWVHSLGRVYFLAFSISFVHGSDFQFQTPTTIQFGRNFSWAYKERFFIVFTSAVDSACPPTIWMAQMG